MKPLRLPARHRTVALALLASAAVHGAMYAGLRARPQPVELEAPVAYSASLDPAAPAATAAPPAAAPAPRRAASSRPRRSPPVLAEETLAPLPALGHEPEIAALAAEPNIEAPEQLALAQPAAPLAADPPGEFPVDALPARVSISYQLSSVFADGRAKYSWSRDGDGYRITGEAEAVGFFTLFLEGRILQESRGTVTARGLRPDRFVESKPNAASEGIDFDWSRKQVTLERGDNRNTMALTDDTVDWLSMIFQMAHQPPRGGAMELRVFTQRRLYRFQLKVLGEEMVEIPLGTVRALHLRHIDPDDATEIVDVWLGMDQYYLPVKLRYPVARNRLMVEQLATKVSTR